MNKMNKCCPQAIFELLVIQLIPFRLPLVQTYYLQIMMALTSFFLALSSLLQFLYFNLFSLFDCIAYYL